MIFLKSIYQLYNVWALRVDFVSTTVFPCLIQTTKVRQSMDKSSTNPPNAAPCLVPGLVGCFALYLRSGHSFRQKQAIFHGNWAAAAATTTTTTTRTATTTTTTTTNNNNNNNSNNNKQQPQTTTTNNNHKQQPQTTTTNNNHDNDNDNNNNNKQTNKQTNKQQKQTTNNQQLHDCLDGFRPRFFFFPWINEYWIHGFHAFTADVQYGSTSDVASLVEQKRVQSNTINYLMISSFWLPNNVQKAIKKHTHLPFIGVLALPPPSDPPNHPSASQDCPADKLGMMRPWDVRCAESKKLPKKMILVIGRNPKQPPGMVQKPCK